MHIVSPFIMPSLGGMEALVEKIARVYQSGGVDVTLYSCALWTSSLTRPFKVQLFGDSLSSWAYQLANQLLSNRREGDIFLFNAFGTHVLQGTLQAVLSLHALKARQIFWVHTPDHLDRTLQLYDADWVLSKFETVVSNSRHVALRYSGRGHRSLYVPSFLTTAELCPVDAPYPPDRGVAYLGRLAARKRADVIADVTKLLPDDIKVVLQGVRCFGADCRFDEVRARTSLTRATFIEGSADPSTQVQRAQVFLQPSSLETCSLALLEAMNRGSIPVTSDIAENVDVVGDAGRSVPHTASAYANAIVDLLGSNRPELHRRSRQRVRAVYSEEIVAPLLLDLVT